MTSEVEQVGERESGSSVRRGRGSVLVVDDDRAAADALVEALRHRGFDTLAAGGATEALTNLRVEAGAG